MNTQHHINYLEIPTRDISASKIFFSQVFAWSFKDYGAEYAAFTDAGVDGGFYQSDVKVSTVQGSVLVVLYSADLEATQGEVKAAGGNICKSIFTFPGGRRFHFTDPSDNEFAVWSDK